MRRKNREEKTEEKFHKSMSCPSILHATIASDFPQLATPLNMPPDVSYVFRELT